MRRPHTCDSTELRRLPHLCLFARAAAWLLVRRRLQSRVVEVVGAHVDSHLQLFGVQADVMVAEMRAHTRPQRQCLGRATAMHGSMRARRLEAVRVGSEDVNQGSEEKM